MSDTLAWILPDSGTEIDFDLVVSENHTNSSQVTDHPVEKGVNVADHVRPEPVTLSLEVVMTNTPLDPDDHGGSVVPITIELPTWTPSNPIAQAESAVSGAVKEALFGPKPPLVINGVIYPTPFDKIQETHNALTTLERSGGTMTVVTSTKNYGDMVLTRVGYERTEWGTGTFKLDFRNIRTVTTQTVVAPKPLEPRGTPKQSKGSQSTSPLSPGKPVSLAVKLGQEGAALLGL